MKSSHRFSFLRKDILQVLGVAAMVAISWILFSGETQPLDVGVAVVAGLTTAMAGLALRKRAGHRQVSLRLWIQYLPAIIAGAVADSVKVSFALFPLMRGRRSRGAFRRLRFDAMADTPEDVGRRILATMGTTLQPNSYVIGFNRKNNEVLVHELVPGPAVEITEKMGRKR